MDELFFSIADAWNNDFSGIFESSLSNEMIENSVSNASAFFDIDLPASIEPGISTGVALGDTSIYYDDTQFFNRLQLEQMGITGQDGLDLVMTHEGTHRALQVLETGFDSYQEELCCDYMAGVRAGLNGMDVSQLENALIELPQDMDHPMGEFRVKAIQEGIEFAQNYIETHETPPTFSDCLDDFKSDNQLHDLAELSRIKNEMYSNECFVDHYQRILEEDPDNVTAQHEYERYKHLFLHSQAEYENRVSFMGRDHAKSAGTISFKNLGETTGGVGRTDGETTGSPGKDSDKTKEFVDDAPSMWSETLNTTSFHSKDAGETTGTYGKDDGETTGGVAKDDGETLGDYGKDAEKKFSSNTSFRSDDSGETAGGPGYNDDGESTGSTGKRESSDFIDVSNNDHSYIRRGISPHSFNGIYTKKEIEAKLQDAKDEMRFQLTKEEQARKEIARLAKAGESTEYARHKLSVAIEKYKEAKKNFDFFSNEKPKDK